MNEETPLSGPDARTVRFLKILVTALAATMIFGVLAIVALLVIRLQAPLPISAGPPVPGSIVLPEGTTAVAVTRGSDWLAIVTSDDRILIYGPTGGSHRQEIAIQQP